MTRNTDVVVVGAGIAGLVAATRLREAGLDVVVLEARDRVGGRVLNVEIGGEPIELGGQWVAPYQSAAHSLLAELGLELFHSFRDGQHVYIGADGEARRYEGHDAPLGDASERAYADGAARLDELAASLDPEAPWQHPDAAELDATTYAAWLADTMADETARDLLDAFLSGGFLTKPAQTFSLLQGLWVIAGAGSLDNLFEPDLCLNSRVVGGSQLIPIRLAERLGDRVVLSAPVRDVRWREDAVEVGAGELSVNARHVVVAVPPNLTSAIRFDPPPPAWRLRLEQGLSQGTTTKVLVGYDEPFWREAGLSGQGFAPYELVRELYDSSPPSGDPGVLVTFLSGEVCERAGRMTPEERRAGVLDGIAKYVGPAALRPTDYVELDWTAEEWSRGAFCATFGPGGLTRFGPDLRRPIGPIDWACTDISGIGYMHMEGAIRSGEAAARAASAG